MRSYSYNRIILPIKVNVVNMQYFAPQNLSLMAGIFSPEIIRNQISSSIYAQYL